MIYKEVSLRNFDYKKIESKQDIVELEFNLILAALAVVYFIFIILGPIKFGKTSEFFITFNLLELHFIYYLSFIIYYLLFIIYFFSFFYRTINIIILYIIFKERKAVLNLLASKIKFVTILLCVILEAFKVKIASLLIKIGIISLVIIHGVLNH